MNIIDLTFQPNPLTPFSARELGGARSPSFFPTPYTLPMLLQREKRGGKIEIFCAIIIL